VIGNASGSRIAISRGSGWLDAVIGRMGGVFTDDRYFGAAPRPKDLSYPHLGINRQRRLVGSCDPRACRVP